MNIGLKPIALMLLLATTFPVGAANAKAPAAPSAYPAPAPAVKVSDFAAHFTSQAPQCDLTDAAAVGVWGDYQETGAALKAAAHELENVARWIGGEVKAGAATTVAGMRALRERLISGALNARDDVDKGIAALDRGVGELNGKSGGAKQAASDKAPS